MLLADERDAVARWARRLGVDGLAVGTSGNLSLRRGDRVAVTPSGLPYDELTPELVAVVDRDGRRLDGELAPTSELPMHLAAYAAADPAAVVHTHSPYATALSTVVDELPAVHYLVALFGGPVRVAPYATYGSEALAAGVAEALADRSAVLLANHGALVVGGALRAAYDGARQLEWLCEVHHHALALGGPRLLDGDEVARVAERLAGYGQRPPRDH